MNNPQPHNLALFVVCCVLCVPNAFVKAEPQASHPLKASIQVVTASKPKPSIRLDAKEKPLGQILDEVAKKTGALIHYSKLSDALVTAACIGDNVGQVMDCLVGKQFSMIAKPSENNKPAEFWLVGTCDGDCQSTASAPTSGQVGKDDSEGKAMTNKLLQEQSDEILRQSQSKDPSERSMAIYNLGVAGQKDDPNVDEALRKALKDEDAMIRAQAVSSIAQRGGENVADNLQEALKDKDANVRLTAVNNIKDDETLLQLASGDSDKSVSHIAQKRLDALMANRHR